MTAASSRDAASPTAHTGGFPLARAAIAAHPSPGHRALGWRFPALPPEAAAFAEAEADLRVVEDAEAAEPQRTRAFGALFAHARSEQIVRALAGRTNLVLPAASALVVGDGPLAAVIAGALARGGARATRAVADPVARLAAHLDGVRTTSAAVLPASDLLVVTGEGHAPADATARRGVAIDASPSGDALLATPGEEVRPSVRTAAEGSWVVEAPGVFSAGSPLSAHIADLLLAFSILTVRTDAADALLAELALA
ncbi:hypothetical protein [Microbacterium tumbae]